MRRIKIVTVALASLLAWTQVLADWDAKLEAEEAAKRQRAVPAGRQKQAEMKSMKDAAMVKAYGKSLKDLEGMSDAELDRFAAELEKNMAAEVREALAHPRRSRRSAESAADQAFLLKLALAVLIGCVLAPLLAAA